MQGKPIMPAGGPPPKSTVELHALAMAAHRRGDAANARELFQACLRRSRDDPAIWSNLGVALRSQRHFIPALCCQLRALEIAPGNPVVLSNLANVLKDLHRVDEAAGIHAQVVTLHPDDVGARLNHACALRHAARFDAALAELDAACALAPTEPRIAFERALILLYLGRYRQGWRAYEARWHIGELPRRSFGCPRWRGEPIRGKRLLIHAEQGFGDTILAARYLPQLMAAGARVSVQCRRELHRLLQGLTGLTVLDTSEPVGDFDFECPMMSLMGIFGTTVESVLPPVRPRIPSSSRRKLAWMRSVDNRHLKVGLVWSGSTTFRNNHNRSLPLRSLLGLIEIPGVRYYSLQQGPPRNELRDCGAGAVIEDLAAWCGDFADTAAAIENLDLIVMTDSAVAHLAATLGKPVVNLLEFVPYWIYTDDDVTRRWYPAMLPVRQRAPGSWDGVFDRAGEIVRRFAAQKRWHNTE